MLKKLLSMSLILSLVSCTTTRLLPPEYHVLMNNIKPGDCLRIHQHQTQFDCQVKYLTPDKIIGSNGEEVPYTKVYAIEKKKYSPGKTAGLVAGIGGVAIGTYLIASVALLGVFALLIRGGH